jgi:hypothetical protein
MLRRLREWVRDIRVMMVTKERAAAVTNRSQLLLSFHIVPPKTRTAGRNASGFLFSLRK